LVKVTKILPDAGITEVVVPEIVTVTPVVPAAYEERLTVTPVIALQIAGSVPLKVESILVLEEDWVIINTSDLAGWRLVGNVAPVQANVTAPADAEAPEFNATVNTLEEKLAALLNAEGAVNVHVGVFGQANPVRVIKILPLAGIVEAAVNVTETVTPVVPAMLMDVDSVTAALVRKVFVKLIAGKVPAEVVSTSALVDVCVLMTMSDLAA